MILEMNALIRKLPLFSALAALLLPVGRRGVLNAQPTRYLHAKQVWTTRDDEVAPLSRTVRFAVDRTGRVFAPEPSESTIYVYDSTGAYIGTIGRKGGGPGEFRGTCCAAFDPKGRLWVRDPGGARYNVFEVSSSTVRPVRARPVFVVHLPHSETNLWIALTFDRYGSLFDLGYKRDPNSPSTARLLRYLVDTAGTVRNTLELPPQLTAVTPSFEVKSEIPGGIRTMFYPQPYGAKAVRADGPLGDFAMAGTGKYDITWRRADGTVRYAIRRDIDGPSLVDAERRRASAGLAAIAKEARVAVSSLPFGIPERKPPIESLEFDYDGRLWVERHTPLGAPNESDVFLPNGQYGFTVVWPSLPNMTFYGAARGSEVWVLTEDRDGMTKIVKLALNAAK